MSRTNGTRGLKKVLSSGDVLVTAFGAMIGWGWVVSSGTWIQQAGAIGTALGFLLGGVMIYFVGMAYAELTTTYPVCGGEKTFCQKAFGTGGSYSCMWLLLLSYIGVVCFEACSLPTIIQYIFPGVLKGYLYTIAGFDIYLSWLLLAIVFALLITMVNIIGVKAAAVLQKTLTIMIAVTGIVLVAISALKGDSQNIVAQVFVGETWDINLKGVLSVAVVAPFFLFGFDVIPQAAEEIAVPLKKLGRLMLLSIFLAVLFYSLIVLAISYGMNPQEINESVSSRGLVAADAMAKLFNSEVMAKIMIIGGLCGIITSWNSFLLGGSRAMFSMASSRMLPKAFGKVHAKYGTPYISIAVIGGISVLSLFLGRAMLVWIADCASCACCIAYCMVSVSFGILRKKEADVERPFRIKHYKVICALASTMAAMLAVLYVIPGSGCTFTMEEAAIMGMWIVVGIILFIIGKIKYKGQFGVEDES